MVACSPTNLHHRPPALRRACRCLPKAAAGPDERQLAVPAHGSGTQWRPAAARARRDATGRPQAARRAEALGNALRVPTAPHATLIGRVGLTEGGQHTRVGSRARSASPRLHQERKEAIGGGAGSSKPRALSSHSQFRFTDTNPWKAAEAATCHRTWKNPGISTLLR